MGSITPCLRWDRAVHAFSSGDAFGDIISVYLTVLSQISFSCEYRILVAEEDLTVPAWAYVAVSKLTEFVTTTTLTYMDVELKLVKTVQLLGHLVLSLSIGYLRLMSNVSTLCCC